LQESQLDGKKPDGIAKLVPQLKLTLHRTDESVDDSLPIRKLLGKNPIVYRALNTLQVSNKPVTHRTSIACPAINKTGSTQSSSLPNFRLGFRPSHGQPPWKFPTAQAHWPNIGIEAGKPSLLWHVHSSKKAEFTME